MPTLISDLDGVVYLGDHEVAGSGAALRRFHSAGWRLVFCTNNSSRTPVASSDKIERVTGFRTEPGTIITSAIAAASLIPPDSRVYVLGGHGLVDAVTRRGCSVVGGGEPADVVVVGLDLDLTYQRLSGAVLALERGATFIASNHDPTYPTREGLRPGAGAIVAAVATAAGREPRFAGKPHEPMRSLLKARTEGHVWIVGDRDDTDLAMGRAEGWDTALVLSGVSKGESQPVSLTAPDLSAVADALLS